MSCRLDPVTLRHLWPRAAREKIDSICEVSEQVFEEFGIDDNYVVAQLMANISHENGGGTIVRESGNYRTERILEIFGSPRSSAAVTPREAQALAHRPEALFERVYNLPHSPKLAKELGNHEPGDGYKYRGAGDLQTTGRDALTRMAKRVACPEIADNPDVLADAKLSFRVAVADFASLGCIPFARKRNSLAVRRKVNGGKNPNGMDEVRVWVRKWETALPDIQEEAKPPRGADTGNKKLTDSTILKGSLGTAVATGGSVLAQVGTATQTASDTASTVQTTIDTVQNTVDTATTVAHGTVTVAKAVHPFLGLMPQVWVGVGIACGVVALIGCGYIAWKRYLKYRDEGV